MERFQSCFLGRGADRTTDGHMRPLPNCCLKLAVPPGPEHCWLWNAASRCAPESVDLLPPAVLPVYLLALGSRVNDIISRAVSSPHSYACVRGIAVGDIVHVHSPAWPDSIEDQAQTLRNRR